MAESILIADIDVAIRDQIVTALRPLGMQIVTLERRSDIDAWLADHACSIALIDQNWDDGAGLSYAVDLKRRMASIVVIVMTDRADLSDVLTALRGRIDDYVLKTDHIDDIRARVEIAWRRAYAVNHMVALVRDIGGCASMLVKPAPAMVIERGPLRIDIRRRFVVVDSRSVYVSRMEFDLLVAFARNEGCVLTSSDLAKSLRGRDSASADASAFIRSLVMRLRRKIRSVFIDEPPRVDILTVRSIGYKLVVRERA